ncbi:DUF6037 family protein [Bifidobacterium sp. ESL0732]|uniref:DUF6037 family protein n=1 Tax=Bifidobacterium sp. ESL0732 TaxID=2983222 RepID=UPI0023F9BD9E|nr:DUF6037 family protein [Bifidobacterium sp. ESL0732]WEV64538.1 DUF6037 family protein [Bifidobacterium sp. ESL0732]
MNNPLGNLKPLKAQMESKNWSIDAFDFRYKKEKYIVLVKLYEKDERKPKYALLKLEFCKSDDITDSLETPANIQGLMIDAKKIREFFGIEYSENLGEILAQFATLLGGYIPIEIGKKTEEQKNAMVHSLSISDREDPNAIYCYKAQRNGKGSNGEQRHRTHFNGEKTKLLRPILFDKLNEDPTISFCYSTDLTDSKTDEEIIANFGDRHN